MKHSTNLTFRAALLIAALSATPVSAVTIPTQGQNAYDFYTRNKAWIQSLMDIKGFSDRIFNQENLEKLGSMALQRLADQGFSQLGIDPDGFLNDLQGQIDKIKEEIAKQEAYITSGAFMNPGTKNVKTSIALNPTLQQMKRDSAVQDLQAAKAAAALLQNTADSATTVEEAKKTSDQLNTSAQDVAKQSLSIGTALNGADSTRDAVQVLGQAVLEQMNSNAMSDAALAAQFAQLAKSMDITNQTMGTLVNDMIMQKRSEALSRQQIVEQKAAEAVTRAENTGDTIRSAGATISGLTAPTTVDGDSIGQLLRGN